MKPIGKSELALLYSAKDNPRMALRELWHILDLTFTDDGERLSVAVRRLGDDKAKMFNNLQIHLIYEYLGKPEQ